MKQKAPNAPSRLLSLDVLRGITIAGMIMVNNPGSWGSIYAPLGHAQWNGLTPTDLVFPFFMFIMGVSMYLSYKKFDFKISTQTFTKLLRRSILLFLIGLGIGWFSLSMRQFNGLSAENMGLFERIWAAVSDIENLRILGVLQRLALVSFFGTSALLLQPNNEMVKIGNKANEILFMVFTFFYNLKLVGSFHYKICSTFKRNI